MLQVFRILTAIDNVQVMDKSIQIEQTGTRDHKKIFKPRCKTNIKKNTLPYKAICNGMHCQTT